MHEIRWGIAGPGRIAQAVVRDFEHVEGARVVAVGSRSTDRARSFADDFGIERAHGSYRALIEDPEVDVLYIATPHPQHVAIATAALEAGKAVLVEKALTATVEGAQKLIETAQQRQVFAMEAMWTRFQPAVVATRDLITDGAIGEVRTVQADLGVQRDFDAGDRLFSKELAGGAMLDLGVYVVSFAQHFLGTPDRMEVTGSLASTGVDLDAAMLLAYDDGRAGLVSCSLRGPSPGTARIVGTDGWIDVASRFHHPHQVTLTRPDEEPRVIDAPPLGTGYSHELIEVSDCLRAGRTESAVMPLEDSLAVQRVLNEACERLGVHHEDDLDLDLG
ncbi:MAG TPA: Gfo/Idh/MocA family oxidoreductase [Ornithinimicrobium sp.]|uniref:Gfo/Idh/MocA family protein n=1 Tax=Ornithinimicrobium sp. TaxID=1977084 RepID=UPI002B47CEEB|nr:Gfo/Idh/MocA family oxidoreductase [Ornithinimicrobium sp.]HKJ11008.1 Gfo/Idh/MocA family oxidoreductase [Ornithinimicrobium sp.]